MTILIPKHDYSNGLKHHWPVYPGTHRRWWVDVVSGLKMEGQGLEFGNYLYGRTGTTPRGHAAFERPYNTAGPRYVYSCSNADGSNVLQDWPAITIALWFKNNRSGATSRFLDKYWDGSNRCFQSYINGSDQIFWSPNTNSVNNNSGLTSVSTLTQDVWYHLVLTWANGTSKIYINGSEDASGSRAGTSLRNNNEELRFFGTYNDSRAWASIGDVRIYNRAVGAAEARAICEDAPIRNTQTPQPLIYPPSAAVAGVQAGPLQAISNGQIHYVDGVDQGLHPIEQGITT